MTLFLYLKQAIIISISYFLIILKKIQKGNNPTVLISYYYTFFSYLEHVQVREDGVRLWEWQPARPHHHPPECPQGKEGQGQDCW